MTQDDLAKKLDVARSTVTQWENGWSSPRMGMVQKLAGVFGVSTSDIVAEYDSSLAMHVKTSSAMVPVRVLGRTHAGERMDEDESDYEAEFPQSVVSRHPNCFALTVEGDCMNRRYHNGDHILVDPDMEPHNGSAVVAEFSDGRSVVRSYLRGSSTLILAPDSYLEGYEDIIIAMDDEPVKLLGVVFWNQAGKETD
jgi:repressor LexA